MAKRLESGEELHLLVSPKSRHLHQGYGPNVFYITYPWANGRQKARTLSEHLYSPLRLPLSRIDVFNTLIAPLVNVSWSLVIHMKTMHAFTAPDSVPPLVGAYHQMNYPRSARVSDAIIVKNSESLRSEILRYMEVDPGKLKPSTKRSITSFSGRVIAVRPRLTLRSTASRNLLCCSSPRYGRIRTAPGSLRVGVGRHDLGDRHLVVVGASRDEEHIASLHSLSAELGIAQDVVFVGAVPLEETVRFYQAADLFVYPSLNETFGLPILEAMACGCPVVTSDTSAMPETAGGAAALSDPKDPASIAKVIIDVLGPERDRMRDLGLRRAAQFSWGATAASTLDVYREVAERREHRRK